MGCEIIKLGDATAIICGTKPDHECDDKGDTLAFNNSGEYFKMSECPDYYEDSEGFIKWHEDKDICGSTVSCSICGKPFSPKMY